MIGIVLLAVHVSTPSWSRPTISGAPRASVAGCSSGLRYVCDSAAAAAAMAAAVTDADARCTVNVKNWPSSSAAG